MKAKRPTKEIARARALYREYMRLDREMLALYDKQDRVNEKRRRAGAKYNLSKQAVDQIMFNRHLGSSKLPKVGWY